MKKPLPLPLIIGVIAVAVLLGGFLVFKGISGPPEFAAPKIAKIIPKYVWDSMSDANKKKMTDEGYVVSDAAAPTGQPSSSPGKTGQ